MKNTKTLRLLSLLMAIIFNSCSSDPGSAKYDLLKSKTEVAVKKNLKDASSYQFISFDTSYKVNAQEIIDKQSEMYLFAKNFNGDPTNLFKAFDEVENLKKSDVKKFYKILDKIVEENKNSEKSKFKWALIKFHAKGELGNDIPMANIVSYFDTFTLDADTNNILLMDKEEVDIYLKKLFEFRSQF